MHKQLIRFDWAIKRLLRNKANFVVLEGFLSELLFEDIKIKRILESESNQETDEDKQNRVDILVENEKNELVIIEIQNTYEIDFFHRMAYGTSKAVAENLSKGQKYAEVKKVISINIVYFDLGQGKDYIYHGKTGFVGMYYQDMLELSERQKATFSKTAVSDIFPEYYLIKVNSFNDHAKNTLDEWVYFLKNSEVKDSFKARGLKEATNALDYMRLTKDEQYSYNRYLDSLHLKASELFSMQEEAAYRVRTQRDMEIAENAIKSGLDNGLIQKLTGLNFEATEKLRNSHQADR